MSHWFVGATYGENDQTELFVNEGVWIRGQNVPQYAEAIKSIQINDRIAIKSVYTRRRPEGLPFENHNQTISVMAIKAIGTVTANPRDGVNISVQWDAVYRNEPPEWYFYTCKHTVWHPRLDRWQTQELIDFTFGNGLQDINRFVEFYNNR